MKKTVQFSFLSAAILLLLCQNAVAQINVGVRAGVNVSNFRPNVFGYDSKTGLNVALLLNMPINRYLGLQVEPGFSQRGAKLDLDGQFLADGVWQRNQIFGKISTGYLELPLLLQYKPRLGKFEGIVSFGPELRFQVGAQTLKATTRYYKDGVLTEDTYSEYDLDFNQRNGYRAFDFGLTGGAGIAYPLQFGKIFTEARYHLGLRKLSSNSELHNRGMSVHVGILVPLKK